MQGSGTAAKNMSVETISMQETPEKTQSERLPVIQIKDLVKIYKLYDKPKDRMKEALGFGKKQVHKQHYALKGINMDIYKGETVGIIGTNGSGKSTILKIITGVLNPTSGQVTVNGRISALLELGAGFNMEYNGIENVYLNGTMMGFSEKEIDGKLPEILEFADIGDYIYQPVRTYSSGMFVRLAFAVAINIEPEILIVDEALSVGDVFFQAKCYHKFEEFKEMGKTIVFVSHDLSSISKYCDRVVLLNQGALLGEGSPKEMIDAYKRVLVGQYELPESQQGESLLEDPEVRHAAKGAAAELSDAGAGSGTPGAGSPGTGAGSPEAGTTSGTTGTGSPGTGAASGMTGAGSPEAGTTSGMTGAGSPDAGAASGTTGAGSPETGTAPGITGTGSPDAGKASGAAGAVGSGQGRETAEKRQGHQMGVNPKLLEYGTKQAEILEFYLTDDRGVRTTAVLKGSEFTVHMRVRFYDHIPAPIFAFTIKNVIGTEITGTNTMLEKAFLESAEPGQVKNITFAQRMNLQGGEYLISFGVTGYNGDAFEVYHRLYDALSITVVSDKNTVGYYDMESTVKVTDG